MTLDATARAVMGGMVCCVVMAIVVVAGNENPSLSRAILIMIDAVGGLLSWRRRDECQWEKLDGECHLHRGEARMQQPFGVEMEGAFGGRHKLVGS